MNLQDITDEIIGLSVVGAATVIDVGGMDNKAISLQDGIPGIFTMGGICAGAWQNITIYAYNSSGGGHAINTTKDHYL